MRFSVLLLLSSFIFKLSLGQKIGDNYISIPNDGTDGYILKLLSDTTIEFSNIRRHMGPSVKRIYKYASTDSTIEIMPGQINVSETSWGTAYIKLPTLSEKVYLKKIKGGFIDYKKSLFYVRSKDWSNNPGVAYIIDGRTYLQKMYLTNGSGLLRKKSTLNKALQKRLKRLPKDKCTLELIRALDAYKRFGIKKVWGVFIITTRK